MLYGALAGFGLTATGIFPLNNLFTTVKGGALTYVLSNFIFYNNVNMYMKEKRSGRKSGIAHVEHAKSMVLGMFLGWSKYF